MGRVVIEVRAREGLNLSGLTEIMEDAARETTITGTSLQRAEESVPTSRDDESTLRERQGASGPTRDVTDVREMDVDLGTLTLLRGGGGEPGRVFPIRMPGVRIGRGDGVEVQIVESGVSRLHAEVRMEGRSIVLIQQSGTNPTLVNGLPVVDRVELRDGDEIQLADRVALGVRLVADGRSPSGSVGGSGLSRTMENKIDLEREIEAFSVMGSFLDVDVVASRSMKGAGEKAEHIIVSFDRFRTYVGGICDEFEGHVLNSNGDELMCFFESARNAVLAGSAILERLAAFNRDQNLLARPFRFRLGVHTGVSLVDLDAGIAYSEVLDTAGHIQKQAEPDTLLISGTTLESLPGDPAVVLVGELTGEGGGLYRVDCPVRSAAIGDSGTPDPA